MTPNSVTAYDQAVLNKSRKDKFMLVFDVPNLIKPLTRKFTRSNDTLQLDTMQFSVYGAVVPRIQVPPVAVNYSGNTLHVSSQTHPGYSPVNINFTIDNQFNNYWVIYTWLNALRDHRSGLYADAADPNRDFSGAMLHKDYATNMTIYGKDEYNQDVIKWTYQHAFPTTLGEIDYSYRTANEIETTFEFVFAEVECQLL